MSLFDVNLHCQAEPDLIVFKILNTFKIGSACRDKVKVNDTMSETHANPLKLQMLD
jgi:hypothetical protein